MEPPIHKEPEILYEDADIIVVNKPPGLLTHPDGVHESPALTQWLLARYPELQSVGDIQLRTDGTVLERPGIVHRLDGPTSGALIVTRTQRAFEFLKRQFHDREVKKVYRAFVYGDIKEERGVIDKPIGTARGGLGPRTARAPHGMLRRAVTTFRVLGRGTDATYVEVFPKTGRTHQIRVHFSAIQHPIIHDNLYAPGRAELLGFGRLALHALSVTFRHPNGQEMTVTAPLPRDFLKAERELRKE